MKRDVGVHDEARIRCFSVMSNVRMVCPAKLQGDGLPVETLDGFAFASGGSRSSSLVAT